MQDVPYGFCHCGCGQKTWIATRSNATLGWVKGEPVAHARGHFRVRQERYRVEDRGYETPCWIWQLSVNNRGYPQATAIDGIERLAHRAYFERAKGLIPQGLELDHLCRNPSCVNPDHLEPVTSAENMRRTRRDYCGRGHEMTEDNLYWYRGKRACRECRRLSAARAEKRRQPRNRKAEAK